MNLFRFPFWFDFLPTRFFWTGQRIEKFYQLLVKDAIKVSQLNSSKCSNTDLSGRCHLGHSLQQRKQTGLPAGESKCINVDNSILKYIIGDSSFLKYTIIDNAILKNEMKGFARLQEEQPLLQSLHIPGELSTFLSQVPQLGNLTRPSSDRTSSLCGRT